MENDTKVPSSLIEDATISVNHGVLVACKIGKLPPKIFFAYEFLSPDTEQRIIKCLDIRQNASKCFIGKSVTTNGDATDTVTMKLETGPFWRLRTCDVLQIPGFKTDDTLENANEVNVNDIDENIFLPMMNYSPLFCYIASFVGFSSEKAENYMTFSRAYIDHYRQGLGISVAQRDIENLQKMDHLDLEWILIESPSILVPFLTQLQFQGETRSSLVNDRVMISAYTGVLVLCRIGLHAFIAFEYMTKDGERTIKRLDFRPDGIKNAVIGSGEITQADMTETDLAKLEIGPFWKLKTNYVLKVPGFKTYGALGIVTDINNEVYSSAGDSSQSFFSLFSKKVDNCMSFSRRYIIKYRHILGIPEDLKKIMNFRWVPIQLPNMLVPIYKNNQINDCKKKNPISLQVNEV